MTVHRWLGQATILAAMALMTGAPIGRAQQEGDNWLDRCRERAGDDRRAVHCEVQERAFQATGRTLAVDGGSHGGVAVRGWDRDSVVVRTRIQAWGNTIGEARQLARQVRIEDGEIIRAVGPASGSDGWWSASFEILVPRRSDLSVETSNGGISIDGVRGRIEFTAANGGISLRDLGGSVRGRTTNGGLNIELAGNRWEGEQLDVSTTNGGIRLFVPERYSARLETGTTNGPLSLDFPVVVQGSIGRRIVTDLGAGGPLIRVVTTNGGVRVRRR